jgi:hypothetical protein
MQCNSGLFILSFMLLIGMYCGRLQFAGEKSKGIPGQGKVLSARLSLPAARRAIPLVPLIPAPTRLIVESHEFGESTK